MRPLAPAAALPLLLVLLGLVVPAPAAAWELARPAPDGLRPVGFAGDTLIADDVHGLVAVDRGGTRRLLARRDIRRTAVSADRLAVVVGGPGRRRPGLRLTQTGRSAGDPYVPFVAAGGRLAGPATLRVGARRTLLGPPGGPLRTVAACPRLPAAEITPAVAGEVAAWRGCDPTQIVVDRPEGRTSIQTDGSVAAIAVDGPRVAWIAVHDLDTPSTLAITDVATGTTTVVDRLLPARRGDQASVALLADRIAAVVPDRDDPNFGSCARSAGPATGPLTADGDTCEPAVLSPAGAVAIRGVEGARRSRVTFAPLGGRPRTLLRATGISEVVAGDSQVAVTRFGCRRERLLLLATNRRRPRVEPTCPVRFSRTPSRVDERGIVRFRLSCPNGCRLPRTAIGLEGGADTNGTVDPRRGVDLPRGGSTTLAFPLPPLLLRKVREGRSRSRAWGIYAPDGDFITGRVFFRP